MADPTRHTGEAGGPSAVGHGSVRPYSYAWRASLAAALFFGFYALALSLAGGALYLAYASISSAHPVFVQSALGCALFAFAVLKATFFVKRPSFEAPGPEITASEEPKLFELIQSVCAQMGTRMPTRIYLIPDVNAFVAEVGGFMGLGSQRVMAIGVGLLDVDDLSELRATIAHEFGHYVAGDTRLGSFIYRTRAAIAQVLTSLGGSWFSKPFEWYGALFMRVTQAVSRAQELAADRSSVTLAGRDALVSSLRHESRAAVLFQHFLGSELTPLLEALHRPDNLYEGFRVFWHARVEQGSVAELDVALENAGTTVYDTHPALGERVRFAESLSDPGLARDRTPARSLLRDPEATERRMTDHILASTGNGPLTRVSWHEVTAKVYAPKLSGDAHLTAGEVAHALGGAPDVSGALMTLLLNLRGIGVKTVGERLEPRLSEVPAQTRDDVSMRLLTFKLGVLFGQALVEAGGEWRSDVGHPHRVLFRSEPLKPFELARAALLSRDGLVELERRYWDARRRDPIA
ncbi:MAG TPA: M48 family metallopeptidase [Polyangiaceae bacterium]|nr:M48 family metallopeptidase [Polyangiaceae bacterium]